jgi:ankyrin repeat protein
MRKSWLTAILILGGSLSLSAGTKLSKAVIANDLAAIKACVAAGEKVNELDKWGWTPLLWATYYRALPAAEYLLKQGADPNLVATKEYNNIAKAASPLIVAAYYGLDDFVRLLVSKGAKRDLEDNKGMTAAAYAKQYHFAEVEQILAGGAGL